MIDIYCRVLNQSFEIHELVAKIKQKVAQEKLLLRQYNQVMGMMDTIFAVSVSK